MKIIAPLKYCTDGGGIVVFTLTVMSVPIFAMPAVPLKLSRQHSPELAFGQAT
jgi:hypothetical protein